jgi:hypothetical protein
MATKLSEFLTANKIDPRRLLAVSQRLERLRREDRLQRLAERKARKSEEGPKKPEAGARTKPHTGRPVTDRSLKAALEGQPIAGPQKTRILRAVNRVLEHRKQPAVELRALF